MNKDGFTLVELLIVIAIIGILSAVAIPNLIRARSQAHDGATQSYIRQVMQGVEAKRDIATHSLPTAQTTCFFYADQAANPTSVKRCKYEPNAATETYMITAESMSGTIFQFDGNTTVKAASY